MNSKILKIIAMVTMLIDHIGSKLYPELDFLRFIGRIAFPLYAFMIVEGVLKTKDIKKYLLKLGGLALVTEPIYNLFQNNTILYLDAQNVIFTLLFGALLVHISEGSKEKWVSPVLFLIFGVLCELIQSDYQMLGIIIIYGFYLSEKTKHKTIVKTVTVTIFITLLIISSFDGYSLQETLMILPRTNIWVHLGMYISVLIISLYNSGYTKMNEFEKWFYWGFYPIHMLIIWMIKSVI